MDRVAFATNVASGVVVAFVVAGLAWGFTDRYAARRSRDEARRERDLAAVSELYRVNGQFFAAWKVWEFRPPTAGPEAAAAHRREVVGLAAAAEGGYESLLVRATLEHDLDEDQQAALWALRGAFKELRRAARTGRPLRWWRSDIHPGTGFREYQAQKSLVAHVAGIFTGDPPAPRRRLARLTRRRTAADVVQTRATALRRVTGTAAPGPPSPGAADLPGWVRVAERLDRDRHHLSPARQLAGEPNPPDQDGTGA